MGNKDQDPRLRVRWCVIYCALLKLAVLVTHESLFGFSSPTGQPCRRQALLLKQPLRLLSQWVRHVRMKFKNLGAWSRVCVCVCVTTVTLLVLPIPCSEKDSVSWSHTVHFQGKGSKCWRPTWSKLGSRRGLCQAGLSAVSKKDGKLAD